MCDMRRITYFVLLVYIASATVKDHPVTEPDRVLDRVIVQGPHGTDLEFKLFSRDMADPAAAAAAFCEDHKMLPIQQCRSQLLLATGPAIARLRQQPQPATPQDGGEVVDAVALLEQAVGQIGNASRF